MEKKKVSYGFSIEALKKGDLCFDYVCGEDGLSFKEALDYVKKFAREIELGHFKKEHFSEFYTISKITITLDKYSDFNEEDQFRENINFIRKYSKRFILRNGKYKKVKF